VAGTTKSFTHGVDDKDFLVYKLDASGSKQWRRNYGGAADDKAFAISLRLD
jgi:hypothetical protein